MNFGANPSLSELSAVLILIFLPFSPLLAEVSSPVRSGPFIVERGGFRKPLVWFKPDEDIHKQVPTDVFCKFIGYINSRNAESAMALCIPFRGFGPEPNPQVTSLLDEKLFAKFVDAALKSAGNSKKRILVSEFAIKGKSGSWRVEYKIDDHVRQTSFKKVDGVWRIIECPTWSDMVLKTNISTTVDWTFP